MDRKEFTTYKQPQSDEKTLNALEAKDKETESKYQQAKIGAKKMDAKSINQLSSSGNAARDKRK